LPQLGSNHVLQHPPCAMKFLDQYFLLSAYEAQTIQSECCICVRHKSHADTWSTRMMTH